MMLDFLRKYLMTKNLRSINPTEHQIQSAIVEWAYNTLTKESYRVSDYLIKIPNEGKRSYQYASKMKREGLKKGVSDLFLAYPKSATLNETGAFCFFGGMFIEVKSRKGKLTEEQAQFITFMSGKYICAVINSVDEGIQTIKDYLGMK